MISRKVELIARFSMKLKYENKVEYVYFIEKFIRACKMTFYIYHHSTFYGAFCLGSLKMIS